MQKANADISSRMSAFEKVWRSFPRRAPPRRTPTPTLQERLVAERDPHVPKSCPPLDSPSISFSVVPNRLTRSPSLNSLTLRSSPIYDNEGTTQIGHRPVAHILPNAPQPENEKDFLCLTQLVQPDAKIAPRSEPTSCHRRDGALPKATRLLRKTAQKTLYALHIYPRCRLRLVLCLSVN